MTKQKRNGWRNSRRWLRTDRTRALRKVSAGDMRQAILKRIHDKEKGTP